MRARADRASCSRLLDACVRRRRCQPRALSSLSLQEEPNRRAPEESDMRLLFAALLFLSMAPALADFSFRFGDRVVATGDSAAMVIDKAVRQPDRIVTLENHRGAAIGERWEYYLEEKQVNIFMRDGKVTRIEDLR
jgi:hypothetical protein